MDAFVVLSVVYECRWAWFPSSVNREDWFRRALAPWLFHLHHLPSTSRRFYLLLWRRKKSLLRATFRRTVQTPLRRMWRSKRTEDSETSKASKASLFFVQNAFFIFVSYIKGPIIIKSIDKYIHSILCRSLQTFRKTWRIQGYCEQ